MRATLPRHGAIRRPFCSTGDREAASTARPTARRDARRAPAGQVSRPNCCKLRASKTHRLSARGVCVDSINRSRGRRCWTPGTPACPPGRRSLGSPLRGSEGHLVSDTTFGRMTGGAVAVGLLLATTAPARAHGSGAAEGSTRPYRQLIPMSKFAQRPGRTLPPAVWASGARTSNPVSGRRNLCRSKEEVLCRWRSWPLSIQRFLK